MWGEYMTSADPAYKLWLVMTSKPNAPIDEVPDCLAVMRQKKKIASLYDDYITWRAILIGMKAGPSTGLSKIYLRGAKIGRYSYDDVGITAMVNTRRLQTPNRSYRKRFLADVSAIDANSFGAALKAMWVSRGRNWWLPSKGQRRADFDQMTDNLMKTS
jgi:hypothetical protein